LILFNAPVVQEEISQGTFVFEDGRKFDAVSFFPRADESALRISSLFFSDLLEAILTSSRRDIRRTATFVLKPTAPFLFFFLLKMEDRARTPLPSLFPGDGIPGGPRCCGNFIGFFFPLFS